MILRLLVLFSIIFSIIPIARGQIGGAFKVKIAALKKPFEVSRFDNIKDLGVLLFEPAANGYTRVYLGTYLGRYTAEIVLQEVKERGYNSPYIEKLPSLYQEPYNKTLTHTVQFLALSKLNMVKIHENPGMSSVLEDLLYISYYDGLYHISLGIIEKEDEARITEFTEAAYRMGFQSSIVKAIYQHKGPQQLPPKSPKKRRPQANLEPTLKLRPVKKDANEF